MYTIGFTTQYYTLWRISERYQHFFNAYSWEWRVNADYIQNLSKDFEKAKEKASLRGEYVIDLEQRGHTSYSYAVSEVYDTRPIDMFTFGKLTGQQITTCDDVWQLTRLWESPNHPGVTPRRAALARRRLIELGEVLLYPRVKIIELTANFTGFVPWIKEENQVWGGKGMTYQEDTLVYGTKEVKYKYISKVELDFIKKQEEKERLRLASIHYFLEGEKVELEVKQVERFGFESMYGYTWIVTFQDIEGRTFKYMGGTPPEEFEEFTKIKATIKHSEYQGIKETRLLRIKVA